MNPHVPATTPIATPYFIESFRRAPDTRHLDPVLMEQWRLRLLRTQMLWNVSTTCSTLFAAIRFGAAELRSPITKIVGIGLGRLDAEPAFYQSALQHMAVFSIASTLHTFNTSRTNNAVAGMEIVLQGPCYTPLDHTLLSSLTPHRITFLSDPEALLAIDASTLLVSAYLPISVPLMQIVAYLSSEPREKGTGMMLWDRVIGMRKSKRWYCMRN